MIGALGSTAWAGAALDDDKKGSPTTANSAETPAPPASDEEPVDYGVGIRLRSVYVPKALMGLFVSVTAGGAQDYGYGIELIRRRGQTELQLGFEFEHISPSEGVYIERGKQVPTDEADYILNPGHSGNELGWFTIDFTFVNHVAITKQLQFRYGGGAGIGIITGELDHFNIQCSAGSSNNNVDPGCIPPLPQYKGASGQMGQGTFTEGGQTPQKYDLPPVFPVVNAIIGLQFKPTPSITINLEGGIRTLPFIGLSGAVFF
jgi:hypothetical protein